MHQFSENLFQNAIDLNETIVFEYSVKEDVISFSENIKKYIPMPLRVFSFVSKMDYLGKIYESDVTKAIGFFTSPKDTDKVRMEYVRFLDFAGEFCWYQLKAKVECDDDGTLKLVYGTLSYIDDETKHQQEESENNKDALTKLLTKESFFKLTDEYLDEIPKGVIPNLMIIDLDDFAGWASVYSEINADGVLIEIGRILKRAFRGNDLIGRIDVDRFAVYMKGIQATNIMLERAAYIRQTVKEVWSDFSNNGSLTVSIGMSAFPGCKVESAVLHAKALAALNDAKSAGKDNYVLYTGDSARTDTSVNPILSTREMEMIRNILDPMFAWAYAVDDNYQLLYRNQVLEERMKNECSGMCYAQLKGYDEPCPDCPIAKMKESESSYDGNVYSTSLRTAVPMRTNRITMRNGRPVYLLASVKDNIEGQIATMNESEERTKESLLRMQDIIWDVNLSRNICVRIKEQNVKSFIDVRIENFKKLREYYVANVVHPEDHIAFFEATDPKYIRQNLNAGRHIMCNEVRMKNMAGEYVWHGFYTMILNLPKDSSEKSEPNDVIPKQREELRAIIIGLDVNEYKRHSIEEIETKIKYEIMREKNSILKDMALNYERHENVNDMIGILVYEYTISSKSYYLCSNFDDVFNVDEDALRDEWSLLNSLRCHPDDENLFAAFKEKVKDSKLAQKCTVRLYNKFDVPIWYTIVVQALRGLNNTPVRYLGTLQNVNAEMKIKAEMEYRADYDSMTGLYNSETFYKKASEEMHMNPDSQYAIISVDVDRFRLINDRYGIDAGNRTLEGLGRIIRDIAPKGSMAKRYQSDIFSVLLRYDSDQEIVAYMNRLSDAVREIKILPVSITLTYGIYKIVDIDVPVRLMCDRARAVKKQVKGSAIANYAVYDDEIRLKLREKAEIEEEMEKALANHEFVIFLQPQINIATGKMIGAEALVRWKHPVKGIMVPAQFLGLFESNGFITKMDMYVWEEACKYIAELQSRGVYIPISVNISRFHIGNTNLRNVLLGLCDQYHIAPKYLELEITENLFMNDVDELFDEMSQLKECGFRILMDDFGSGYSSLNMLRNAPVDTLKIDRFFFDEIMSTDRGKIIIEASVRMAKQLGLTVVAEGVETEEQLQFLKRVECDIAQGYYFSRPISTSEFEIFMENNR